MSLRSTLGQTSDAWFGLYKTTDCTYSACVYQSNLFWDIYPGLVASTSTYTATTDFNDPDHCIRVTTAGQWYDRDCTIAYSYFCETQLGEQHANKM